MIPIRCFAPLVEARTTFDHLGSHQKKVRAPNCKNGGGHVRSGDRCQRVLAPKSKTYSLKFGFHQDM